MDSFALGLLLLFSTNFTTLNVASQTMQIVQSQQKALASHDLDLTQREADPGINQGFADNILLALHYLKGDVGTLPIDWNKIRESATIEFTLQPGEVFAFHDNVLAQFTNPKVTLNSKFITTEGYLAVAGLGGNGVCHLASLINWVAKDAGLETTVKANHDFAPVVGVPREYGVSIMSTSPEQNLYIRNDQAFPVVFRFIIDQQNIKLTIIQAN